MLGLYGVFYLDIFRIVTMFGSLAMFFYGMELMGNGLKKSSGDTLRSILERMTKSTLTGMITGMLVTAIIQSSSATIVLTVGLMAAGILNLRQSVTIVMGANIGTTVTAQIIRLMDVEASGNIFLMLINPTFLAPLTLVVGVILVLFVKKGMSAGIGEILVGFGILFLGLIGMKDSVTPLAQSPVFLTTLEQFSKLPLLGLVTGVVVTVIVQSSSAVIGMMQALSTTGAMKFELIYPIVMGINIGTCIVTAILCSIGTTRDAKRTAVAHILFNVIGTFVFMLIIALIHRLGGLTWLWAMQVNSGVIADFQTLFNVLTAIMLMPFTDLLVKASMAIVKPSADEEVRASEKGMLDEKLLLAPGLAVGAASRALAYMGKLAKDNLALSLAQFVNYSSDISDAIISKEDRIDSFADRADNFLIKLSKALDTGSDEGEINLLMQATPDFERIGDYATNLNELALKLHNSRVDFSEKALYELGVIGEAVLEIVDLTVTAIKEDDEAIARRIEPLEEVIDDMVLVLRDNHTGRLKADNCTVQGGLIFLEALTNIERAADQCSNIALHMLARSDRSISLNHHVYLKKLHEDGGDEYRAEFEMQRKRYLSRVTADNGDEQEPVEADTELAQIGLFP